LKERKVRSKRVKKVRTMDGGSVIKEGERDTREIMEKRKAKIKGGGKKTVIRKEWKEMMV
jgi:hypothetical protein